MVEEVEVEVHRINFITELRNIVFIKAATAEDQEEEMAEEMEAVEGLEVLEVL